ncbi:MAG: hypothetical protein QM804_08465 [Propionicimonas sp.]
MGLQRKDREIALHGYETGRIVRLPDGKYVEVHQEVDAYERWRLVDQETSEPVITRPDEDGRIRWRNRARARLSRWFFQDRLLPIPPEIVAPEPEGRSGEDPESAPQPVNSR